MDVAPIIDMVVDKNAFLAGSSFEAPAQQQRHIGRNRQAFFRGPTGGRVGNIALNFDPSQVAHRSSFFVCFRWKTDSKKELEYVEARPDRLGRNNDGTTWTVTTTVPLSLKEVPSGTAVETALPLVPLADVRIVAIKEDKTLAADVLATIGITHPWAAIFLAVATIAIALVALTIIANLRLKHPGINKASWFLRIISTPSGYASLSQLQIVLWTLVVAASAPGFIDQSSTASPI
jgi:hypothetical protein